jgi:hypothetical protein
MRLVVNRLLVWSCIAIAAVATTGCASDRVVEPGSVTGTWTGTVVVGSRPSTLTLALVQDGSSVSGTAYGETPGDEPDEVSGSVSEGKLQLTITASPDPAVDDCHLFPVYLTLDVQDDLLIITDASGLSCEGDGQGGHRSLSDITGASGTLNRK